MGGKRMKRREIDRIWVYSSARPPFMYQPGLPIPRPLILSSSPPRILPKPVELTRSQRPSQPHPALPSVTSNTPTRSPSYKRRSRGRSSGSRGGRWPSCLGGLLRRCMRIGVCRTVGEEVEEGRYCRRGGRWVRNRRNIEMMSKCEIRIHHPAD